ncbi:MAG: hypothetical protein IGS39_22795 [Calothrix sp. C42_A2020_038]|nr:hypothetical protein [Calothrix sp. C42_A2020_038]
MGRHSKIAVIAIAILAIAGCSSDGEEQASTPTPTPAVTTPSATSVAPFNNPVVAGKPQENPVVNAATPNLIQPTNSVERALVVTKGRPDPFAQIVTPSIPMLPRSTTEPVIAPSATVRRPLPQLPTLPSRATTAANPNFRQRSAVISAGTQRRPVTIASSKLPTPPKQIARDRGFTPVLPRVMPQIVPNPSLVSVLPPTPQPELARAIAVTGVVVVGREPKAIIKVPTEPTSRYVQAGDRLSNGLLVKRIEMNEGSDPVVIFEQFGIEVARMVGEGAAAPATTASVDSASPPPNNLPTGAS